MTPITFHQTQTREQKLVQLAQEVTKAGSLEAFFSKLTATSRHGAQASHRPAGTYLVEQRMHTQR